MCSTSEAAIPADSWPRCCCAKSPKYMSLATSSPGAHTPKTPHSSFGLSAPTSRSMLTPARRASGNAWSANEDGNALDGVVAVAADVPLGLEGLRLPGTVRRARAERMVPGVGIPIEGPRAPGVGRDRERPEPRVG